MTVKSESVPSPEELAAPKRIYLQWFGDADPADFDSPPAHENVTWCDDRIFEHDVEYIRADAVEHLLTLVKRARTMIDVAPSAPITEWPTEPEIDALVADCDKALADLAPPRR